MSRVIVTLSLWEATRLIRHPLVVAGVVSAGVWFWVPAVRHSRYLASNTAFDVPSVKVFLLLTTLPGLVLAPMTALATSLAATRAQRAAAGDIVAAVPLAVRPRTVALLAAVGGPAGLAAVIVSVQYVAFRLAGPVPSRWPDVAELGLQPAMVLGGGLVGIAVARWCRRASATAVALVLLAATYPVGAVLGRETWLMFGPVVDLVATDEDGRFRGYVSASVAWHLAYLICSCVVIATLALLATPGRRKELLTIGGLALLAAVVTGVAQLP